MEPTHIKKWGINGFTLKWIAMIAMAVDHTGMMLFPQHMIFRIIGRLAFPIYCFLLVEGAVRTSNKKKYLGRLFLFALISEIPFNLVCAGKIFSLEYQNVFFTLCLGLAAVLVLQAQWNKACSFIIILVIIFFAQFANTDYGGGGVCFILLFYMFREQILLKSAAFALADIFIYGGIQSYGVLSLIPILCYNGKRGPGMKYFFYIFYPVHLLVLYWLKLWILGIW